MAIHSRQLAEHGGADGVRDVGLLQSASARPRQHFAYTDPTPDMASLAAAHAFAISKNHAILDANKRTAAVACETLLEMSSFSLTATDAELYPACIALAVGDWDEATFTKWLLPHARPGTPKQKAN